MTSEQAAKLVESVHGIQAGLFILIMLLILAWMIGPRR